MRINTRGISLICAGTLLVFLSATSCAPVKPYQRAYLNDDAMQPGRTSLEKFDENVHTYREGSSGGGSGRSSGGCGCN